MGKPKAIVEVNGTELYLGGSTDNVVLPKNGARVRVACVSCRFLQCGLGNMPAYSCGRIIDDYGKCRSLEDETRFVTRCEEWQPQTRWFRLGKSSGKIDSPELIKWKTENPHILGWPEEYGYTKDMPWRNWLNAMFLRKLKQTPTTKKHNEPENSVYN